MQSQKCPHCGLVNFANTETCKKCKQDINAAPNLKTQAKFRSFNPDERLCLTCGIIGLPAQKSGTGGLWFVFFILWIVGSFVSMFLGGFFFILFIATLIINLAKGSNNVCKQCSHKNIIPTNTPIAQDFLSKQ